jgi:hypothetical protein
MNIDVEELTHIEVEGARVEDYPEFTDAYLSYAELNGRELTQEELDYITEHHREFIQEFALVDFVNDRLYGAYLNEQF